MMTKYTTYCTEEQTNRAIKLGCPCENPDDYNPIKLPTTQQMINWLEIEKGQIIEVCRLSESSNLWVSLNDTQEVGKYFENRCEAELYAIDSALIYLEKEI